MSNLTSKTSQNRCKERQHQQSVRPQETDAVTCECYCDACQTYVCRNLDAGGMSRNGAIFVSIIGRGDHLKASGQNPAPFRRPLTRLAPTDHLTLERLDVSSGTNLEASDTENVASAHRRGVPQMMVESALVCNGSCSYVLAICPCHPCHNREQGCGFPSLFCMGCAINILTQKAGTTSTT